MLKRFEFVNFKNFSNPIILDFTDVREYQFNKCCIKNNLLNKIIVYGKNAVGKTNLGLALFDITTHLTNNSVVSFFLYNDYLNADNAAKYAEFHYDFKFGNSEVSYIYRKSNTSELSYEEVIVDGEQIFSYDFITKESNFNNLKKYVPYLNFEFRDTNLSVLRYIVNNSKAEDVLPLKELVRFISKMLWFQTISQNYHIGYNPNRDDYYEFIFENDNLKEFEEFLNKYGIHESLIAKVDPAGEKVLYFNKKRPLRFFKTVSSGTRALYSTFYWMKIAKEVSFLFIDEFDAFYHVELSEAIVKMLEEQQSFQTILTSHNTNLLSNRIMRPDCYFILTPEKLVSFANATNRELREGHNLEKLYISGEFDG